MNASARAGDAGRIEWLDHAKGLCIILVVMLYATDLAADRAGHEGWLHAVAHFAKPFRMPDFFLLSGLLLPLVIDRPWRRYVDRKVVHFAYFYVLWVTILFAFKAAISMAEGGGDPWAAYLVAFVRPYSMLWFIYMLAVFFVVTRLLRRVPAALVWGAAAALFVLQPATDVKVLQKFTQYYVFFYTGYAAAPWVFRFARQVGAAPRAALLAIAGWALANGFFVQQGWAGLPGVNLALALAGSAAVIAVAVLASRLPALRPIAYCGAHSIVVYLAFFIPLILARKALSVGGLVQDVGWMSFWSTLLAIAGALAMHRAVRGTPLAFLFRRPAFLGIDRAPAAPATPPVSELTLDKATR